MRSKLIRLFNRFLYILSGAALIAGMALSTSFQAVLASAGGNSGSIWTTNGDCGTSNQDVNHYNVGDHVYVNFSNFAPGYYSWSIDYTGQGGNVTSGHITIGQSGAGCFDAHTIQPNEADHEFKVTIGNKNDNYQVNEYHSPTPTKTTPAPTQTTPAPTQTTPAPTVTTPAPTQTTPAPTETTPAPTVTTPAPTQTTPAPTETTPAPTVTTPAPTETTPAPTETTPAPTETTPAPTQTTPAPTETTPAPTETTPAPTETTPAPSETPVIPVTGLSPLVFIDPYCTVSGGSLQWTVENPNAVNMNVLYWTLDGGAQNAGFTALPGSNLLTTTLPGTHTITVVYGDSQSVSDTSTVQVCPLPVPNTGNGLLIPVTGANDTQKLGQGLLFGGLSFAGLGVLLSVLRKFLNL